MDISNRHPLDAITKNNSLSMLEALIPYVEYPLKLPLALLIKFNEIRLIIDAFRSINQLTGLGLHHPSRDPMDMLCGLTGISPEMLKMIMSLAENMNGSFSPEMLSPFMGNADMSSMANLFGQSVNADPKVNVPDATGTTASSSASFSDFSSPMPDEAQEFDRRIQNILAEYDLQQAEQLSAQSFSNSESKHDEIPDSAI